jgi:trimethylamine--corrinoid protein Co-methyltransferase
MRPLRHFFQVLSEEELDRLHEAALQILADPGMRLENAALLSALQRAGASVDAQAQLVRFPRRLVEQAVAVAAREETLRRTEGRPESELGYPRQLTFSWHTPFRNRTPPVQASIGGGAPLFYDHARKANRYATRQDFLATIRLAEGLPQVVTMGNGVHCLKEDDGRDVPPKMVAIEGAALVARHSSKPGCTSIIDRRQLPFLRELGEIVKGSAQAYLRNPILVNIHDTESPLRLTRPEAAIIEDMARAGLSIFILPMPLAAISTPVYPIAAAIVAAAEILGVWTAVKALNPDCPVEARCVAGVLNPANGAASFAAPETVLIDLAVARLFRERYGVPCGTGVGLIDAPVPGALSIYERTFKACSAALAGEPSFPAGIIGGAVVFSPEQVLLDLDIAAGQAQLLRGIGGEHFAESPALIRERGIGGLHLDSEHTARHFRECLQIPTVLPRLKSTDAGGALSQDPVQIAHLRYREILEANPLREPEEDRARQIDRVVREARRALGSLTGALE